MKRADVVTVGRLFSRAARFRCGPARPGFHWGPPQVAQIIVDLETAARDSVDEQDVPEERFYLGVITVCPLQRGVSTLLDGQQRLVVLSMFLAFARDRLPNAGERTRIERMLMRRFPGQLPEPRLRLAPEGHVWFAHFILPPGATRRLPATAPLGSPKELLLASRFMEHAFASYSVADLRNMVDFLTHHTAVVCSIAEPRPAFAPASSAPSRQIWGDEPLPAPASARYRVAAE